MYHVQAFSHVLKRGVDTLQNPQFGSGLEEQDPFKAIRDQVSPAGAFLVFTTILLFVVVLTCVRYTLLGVVATLAQVETPESHFVPLDSNKDNQRAPLAGQNEDEEVLLIQASPITSSIRQTLRHITARAGFASRWRGFWCAVCTALAHGIVYQLALHSLNLIFPLFLASLFGGLVTSIVLARWYMAWTHIVISEPSSKPWYRRVPSFSTWRKIWAPTAINALAGQLAFLVPAFAWVGFGLHKAVVEQEMSAFGAAWRIITVLLLALVTYISIVIPAQVALTRCQASMLPDEDESIVPFDRSYSGKVTPAIVGGSGMLSYIDAWKSFDRAARIRLVKLYLKIFAIDVALHILFGLVLTVQLTLMISSASKKAKQG